MIAGDWLLQLSYDPAVYHCDIHKLKWQAFFDSPKIKRTVHVVSGRCWVAAIIGESLAKAGITDNQKHELLLHGQDMKCWSWWWWDIASSYLPRLAIHNPLFPHSGYLIKCFPNHGYLILFLQFLTLFLLLLLNIPAISWNVSLIRDTFKFCLPPCHLQASAFTRMWPTLGGSCQSPVFQMSPLWFVFSNSIKSGLVHKKEGQFLIERCSFF